MKVVDLDTSGDTIQSKLKLLEQTIESLYPEMMPFSGWNLDVSPTLSSIVPRKVMGAATQQVAKETVVKLLVISAEDVRLVKEAVKTSRELRKEEDLIIIEEYDKNNQAQYASEVQDLSDDEDNYEKHDIQTAKIAETNNNNDEDFDMFAGVADENIVIVPATRTTTTELSTDEHAAAEHQVVENKNADFLSLTVVELLAMLSRIERAIEVRKG